MGTFPKLDHQILAKPFVLNDPLIKNIISFLQLGLNEADTLRDLFILKSIYTKVFGIGAKIIKKCD